MKEGDKVRLKFGRVSGACYAKNETGVITEMYPEGSKYFCCVKLDDNVEAFEKKYGKHLKALGYTLVSDRPAGQPDSFLSGVSQRCYCFFREEIEPV